MLVCQACGCPTSEHYRLQIDPADLDSGNEIGLAARIGKMLRFLTAGESHGPEITAILEGMPAGLALDYDELARQMARRQKGYGSGGRMKIEKDAALITGGVMNGNVLLADPSPSESAI